VTNGAATRTWQTLRALSIRPEYFLTPQGIALEFLVRKTISSSSSANFRVRFEDVKGDQAIWLTSDDSVLVLNLQLLEASNGLNAYFGANNGPMTNAVLDAIAFGRQINVYFEVWIETSGTTYQIDYSSAELVRHLD
jgi:hypothetical protein